MDDLRRLLALHQRELENLQRQCDARAASARKSPSSPHLVQLRKLYNTLAKQRRHVEALEVLRTLESLEWREAESQREQAEQRNEAEFEALLQRHGGERQLLEQHLLRTQHTAGATDLASSWCPEPPAALLEAQHGLQHRHRRLRSVPPSLPCTAPNMLRCGASYEPEHIQQGPEGCEAYSWRVAGEVPMQSCIRVECSVSRPCSPYSMRGKRGADVQTWQDDLHPLHGPSEGCCWQHCGGDRGTVWKLGPPPPCSSDCRVGGKHAAEEHVYDMDPPEGGDWSLAAAVLGGADANSLQLNVEMQDMPLPVRQSCFTVSGEAGNCSAVHQQQPAASDPAVLEGCTTTPAPAAAARTAGASQAPIAVFDSADWDVFSTLQQAAEQWYWQQAPHRAQPPVCPGQRGCPAPVEARGRPPQQPQSPLAQRLSQLRYSPAGQTPPRTPGMAAQPLQPPGWIRAVPGRRAGSAPVTRGSDGGTSKDGMCKSTRALNSITLPSIHGQAQPPQGCQAPSVHVVKQGDLTQSQSRGSVTGRLAVLKRQTSLPVWAAGMPRTNAGPLRPSHLCCGATGGDAVSSMSEQVRLVLAEEPAIPTSCPPEQPALQPPQPERVPSQLVEQQQKQGPSGSCAQPQLHHQDCDSGPVPQGAGLPADCRQCAREPSPPAACEPAAVEGSSTKVGILQPEALVREHGAALCQGVEPTATQLPDRLPGARQPAHADANQQQGKAPAAPAAPLAASQPVDSIFSPRAAHTACSPDSSVSVSQHSTVPHDRQREAAGDTSFAGSVSGQPHDASGSAAGTALSGGVGTGQQGRAATETPRSPSTSGHSEDAEAAADLLNFCRYGRYEDARQLMREAKRPIDVRDMSGNTPLMLACQGSYGRLVKLCLRKGADVNAQNAAGETALLLAAAAEHRGCAKYLLECGADPTLKTKDGRTAEELILKWAAGWAADWHLREPDLHT